MSSVHLSVGLSVTLVDQDHTGWKSWKLIAQTISPTPSLFAAQRPSTYSQGNVGKFRADWRWGGKKWRAGAQKRQYLKCIKIQEKLICRAHRKLQTLFRMVYPRPPTVSLPLDWGFATPPQNCNRYYLKNG